MKKLFMSIYEFLFGKNEQFRREPNSPEVFKEIQDELSTELRERACKVQEEVKIEQEKLTPTYPVLPSSKPSPELKTLFEIGDVIENPTIIRYPTGVILTEKQFWMLSFVKSKEGYVSPTEAGRMYGILIKNRLDYNSGHARSCLLRLVGYGVLLKNEYGHYKYTDYECES